MIQVYCGDGKGKTTAAIGQAIRAAGRGKRVLMARFLKTEDSGEVKILHQISGLELLVCEKSFGFYRFMSEEQKREAESYYQDLFEHASLRAEKEGWDMLVLDEIMAACQYGLVLEQRLVAFLDACPKELEVVMTGRNPSEEILRRADYVTEMVKRKHPYDRGISARRGIEY
ncbi:MAG: cob(I)yrinic acid a,c-diamide adenosyltransferase [bacterium]|nr:cob(I)yrinic acid a,c-diamide adenosyltransferase [bacterium]